MAIIAEDAAGFDRWFANEMRPAPELTHFGSRQTIAATDLPNRRGYLSGWIVNPAALKRGSQMPENNIEAAVLHQLVGYLESLR